MTTKAMGVMAAVVAPALVVGSVAAQVGQRWRDDPAQAALARAMDKGALGSVVVTSETQPGIFKALTPPVASRPSGH